MKQAFAIRHVAFEDLGCLAPLLDQKGFTTSYLDAGVDDLAAARAADFLVVLGGPIGAYEEGRYPFLKDEMRLIEAALKRGVPILGICLGAQLLAKALGARVYAGAGKEIGFAPIDLTADGRGSCLSSLESCACVVLHWHGDTFDIPAGATRLAATAMTPNQAFALNNRVLALQFHMETDPRRFERWLVGHTCELTAEKIDIPALRAAGVRHGSPLAESGRAAFEKWLDQTGLA